EYVNADFLIFLSNGPEGQPVVLIEALMVGRAVIIAKDICGIGEYMRTGYNGFLVEKYDDALPIITDFSAQILEDIRSNARKTYLEHFSVPIFSQAVSVIFEKPFTNSECDRTRARANGG